MPRLPGEMRRGIEERDKKILGEEGVLSRFELNQERYWAKQWRGKHAGLLAPNRLEGRSIRYPEDSEKTPVSPYWHKLKFYENNLIHEAFPEMTLKIEGAYDPRISTSGELTSAMEGRPVTMARNVEGDPELLAQRDGIIMPRYEQKWRQNSVNEQTGVEDTRGQFGAFFIADMEMMRDFGPELMVDIRGFDPKRPDESMGIIAERMKDRYGDVPVVQLLEAGVVPNHATFNFLPTKREGDEVTGVFIETMLLSPKRLLAKIHERIAASGNTPELVARLQDKATKRMERYVIFRTLDDLWDQMMVFQSQTDDSNALRQPEVAAAVFDLTNTVRTILETTETDPDVFYDRGLINRLERLLEPWFNKSVEQLREELQRETQALRSEYLSS